jgi:hypothetical protein
MRQRFSDCSHPDLVPNVVLEGIGAYKANSQWFVGGLNADEAIPRGLYPIPARPLTGFRSCFLPRTWLSEPVLTGVHWRALV